MESKASCLDCLMSEDAWEVKSQASPSCFCSDRLLPTPSAEALDVFFGVLLDGAANLFEDRFVHASFGVALAQVGQRVGLGPQLAVAPDLDGGAAHLRGQRDELRVADVAALP